MVGVVFSQTSVESMFADPTKYTLILWLWSDMLSYNEHSVLVSKCSRLTSQSSHQNCDNHTFTSLATLSSSGERILSFWFSESDYLF